MHDEIHKQPPVNPISMLELIANTLPEEQSGGSPCRGGSRKTVMVITQHTCDDLLII